MGCCKGSSAGYSSTNYNSIDVTTDKAPDGITIGQDGSKGGTIPYYSTPGGAVSTSSNSSGGSYTANDTEHSTGLNYSAKKANSNVAKGLGGLSSKYESNGDPGSIGYDSTGGYSYGKYQISTKVGSMNNFLTYEKTNNPSAYSKLMAAGGDSISGQSSSSFQSAWKDLAANDSSFSSDQDGFIQSTHYDIAASNILNSTGLDVNKRSLAVQDVVWSTSVQNGPNSSVFTNAFAGKDVNSMSDADIINSIYDERSKTTSSGTLVYFSKSSKSIQNSVANRLTNERQDALAMLS